MLVVAVYLKWLGHDSGVGVSGVRRLKGMLLGVLWFQGRGLSGG